MRNALMIASIAAASFFAVSTVTAFAEETKTVTRTITVYTVDDVPELKAKLVAICGDKAVKLSDKARNACETKAYPPLTKAKTFRNSGVGAEFATLVRNR